jgi:hypothetical protein
MSKIILIGLVLLCIPRIAICSDHYQPGDTLYVWASSGLRLRSEPGIKSKVITTIKFGEPVKVLEMTDVSYNFDLIPGSTDVISKSKTDPIIAYGHRVKVMVDSNTVGYVIDQYLLAFEPYKSNKKYVWELNPVKIGTMTRHDYTYGNSTEQILKKTYNAGIIEVETTGENKESSEYTFPGFTIEEVLIIFSKYSEEYKNHLVEQNWENEIVLTNDNCCTITFKKEKDHISVQYSCGC